MSINVIFLALLPALATAQTEYFLLYQSHLNQINSTIATQNVSMACEEQLSIYLQGLIDQEQWALQMFDAKTKFPTGVLAGNYYDLGNFDECLNIQTDTTTGKYCLGTILVPTGGLTKISLSKGGQLRMLGNDPKFSGLHYATCVPRQCSAEDAVKIYPWQTFDEKYCYSKDTEPELTWAPIFTITLLSVFLVFVVLSTSYDVYLHYKNYKPGRDVAVAFSYFTNGKKLITPTKNPDQLLCLNGLKALSMMWIIIGHEYTNGASGAVANYLQITKFIQDPANMFIIGATVAVDTFFVIGGLVTVYTFLKAVDKGVRFNIPMYYIHRYIRLTPALAVVVLIHATLLKHLGNGPLWNTFDDHLVEACKKHWWAALLYIQNYVHDEQACVPQTWYLSIDMQLFILSPLVLLPLRKWPKPTVAALFVLTLAGIAVPFAIAFAEELRAFMIYDKDITQRYMFFYYEQTYGRFGPYVMGMILGYFIYKIKIGQMKVKLSWETALILWVTCLAGGIACVYAGHNTMLSDYSKWSHSLYIAFSRPAWSLAICGIIFACVTGYGGPIDNFLSCSLFQFIAKISYSIYLVHYALIFLRAASYKTEITIEHFYVFFDFWGDFVFSVALALILCLTFESPMISIEKLLFNKNK